MGSPSFAPAADRAGQPTDLSGLLSARRWAQRLPRISVIVPTFNRASHLEIAIASIFGQTIPVHEVLVVDDGSTDQTASQVSALRARHPGWDRRLHYIRRPHEGKSAALNEGLKAATGEWIAFNDSDDQWVPRKLELQLHALALHEEADACFADVRFVNNPAMPKTAFEDARLNYDGTFGVETGLPEMFGSGWPGIYMQTMLVSATALGVCGTFDQNIRVSMDTDFVFRLGLVTPLCFVNLPLVDVDRAEGRSGLMTLYPFGSLVRLQAHVRVLTKWVSLTRDNRPALRSRLRHRRSQAQSSLANCYVLGDDLRSARSVLTQAIRQNPQPFLIAKYLWSWVAPGALKREIQRRNAIRAASY